MKAAESKPCLTNVENLRVQNSYNLTVQKLQPHPVKFRTCNIYVMSTSMYFKFIKVNVFRKLQSAKSNIFMDINNYLATMIMGNVFKNNIYGLNIDKIFGGQKMEIGENEPV
eukprot:TRINITY_DN8241_c0_g1_i2.p4 TRINITY_DN8241_c0_g1~~TRINITY_DN8241_c0_g1_i2.p4  ORF type:complete len:112 (-),score=9.26 TRINITY_DN8241_c0_g1_i2:12-347(-)